MQKKNSFQKKLTNYIEQVLIAFDIEVEPETKERLVTYFLQLYLWNRSKNLTGIKDLDILIYKHLGDSLILLKHLDNHLETMLDIGTGQGVPGLIVKILRPNLKVVLAEASKKKCSFLKFVIALLRLKDIKVCEKRIDPKNPPCLFENSGFDVIVSQATGALSWLVDISHPFLKDGGKIISLKGPKGLYEVEELKKIFKKRGQMLIIDVIEEHLPILDQKRLLIFIQFRN